MDDKANCSDEYLRPAMLPLYSTEVDQADGLYEELGATLTVLTVKL